MRVFKYRHFNHWAISERISDNTLKKAIEEMANGLYEANLGSGLYKKRIASANKGKRSGYRTLIAFKSETRAVYVYGFSKNDRGNISEMEEKIYRQLAKSFLLMNEKAINEMLRQHKLIEVI